jgi:hypothetical protein
MTIFKLPESGDVSLDNDVVIDDDDFRRFTAAGGLIYTRGFAVEVRAKGGYGAVTFHKPRALTMRAPWHLGAQHFQQLAKERADEGTSIQLACLVLAEHCRYEGSGGPSAEMVALAENTLGVQVSEVIADLLRQHIREDVVPSRGTP